MGSSRWTKQFMQVICSSLHMGDEVPTFRLFMATEFFARKNGMPENKLLHVYTMINNRITPRAFRFFLETETNKTSQPLLPMHISGKCTPRIIHLSPLTPPSGLLVASSFWKVQTWAWHRRQRDLASGYFSQRHSNQEELALPSLYSSLHSILLAKPYVPSLKGRN